MTRILLFIVLALSAAGKTLSQPDSVLLDDLYFNADVMVNADNAGHRSRAYHDFSDAFVQLLRSDVGGKLQFDSLKWVQKVYSADSLLRIFTWELRVSDDEFRYSGIVQTIGGSNGNSVTELVQSRSLNSEYSPYDAQTWYGALYYGLKEYTGSSGEKRYLLLGFNAKDSRTDLKTADILFFKQGKVFFGSPDFQSDDGNKDRIIIEYSDGATGRMQFDNDLGMLIYDNIITIPGGPEGVLSVPDGSFRGYQYKEGMWSAIDKVFTQTVDEPPGEGIKKTGEDLDIFGRKKEDH